MYTIFVCHPGSALSRRSETCDIFSVSVSSMGIKPPRPLRSLREIITTTRMFCFRTQSAQRPQRFYYITLSLEGSLAPRSLRSLREIYNHHTDVFFPHAEDAKVAKILLLTRSLEGSLATRDMRTQRLVEISSCLLYSFAILALRSPVVVKLATSPASALTVWEIKLRVLCALCVRHIASTRMFCFRTQRTQRSQRFYYITLSLEWSLALRSLRSLREI